MKTLADRNAPWDRSALAPYLEALAIPPIILFHRIGYVATGEVLSRQPQDFSPLLMTALDAHIPFVPAFILPYLLTWVYPLIIFAYAVASGSYDRLLFRYFYFSIIVMTLIECLIWYSFPASIGIRVSHETLASSGWLGGLTAWVYQRATPWNVFPSAHIAFPFIVLLFSRHFVPDRHRWMFAAAFLVIAASVLFIKNHYVIDIAGGMALALLVYGGIFRPALQRRLLHGLSSGFVVSASYLAAAAAAFAFFTFAEAPWI